jgi:hypothetical protein
LSYEEVLGSVRKDSNPTENNKELAERGERFSPFSKTFEKRPFSSVFSHFPTFRLLSGGEYRPSELG